LYLHTAWKWRVMIYQPRFGSYWIGSSGLKLLELIASNSPPFSVENRELCCFAHFNAGTSPLTEQHEQHEHLKQMVLWKRSWRLEKPFKRLSVCNEFSSNSVSGYTCVRELRVGRF
jgi:hypothetical protein